MQPLAILLTALLALGGAACDRPPRLEPAAALFQQAEPQPADEADGHGLTLDARSAPAPRVTAPARAAPETALSADPGQRSTAPGLPAGDALRADFGDPLPADLAHALVRTLCDRERYSEAAGELRRHALAPIRGSVELVGLQSIFHGLLSLDRAHEAANLVRDLLAAQVQPADLIRHCSSSERNDLLDLVAELTGPSGEGLRNWIWKGAPGVSEAPWRWGGGRYSTIRVEDLVRTVSDKTELRQRLEPLFTESFTGWRAFERAVGTLQGPERRLEYLLQAWLPFEGERLPQMQFAALLDLEDVAQARQLALERLAAGAELEPYLDRALWDQQRELSGALLEAALPGAEDWSIDTLVELGHRAPSLEDPELAGQLLDLTLARDPRELLAYERFDAESLILLTSSQGNGALNERQRAGVLALLDTLESTVLRVESEDNEGTPADPEFFFDDYGRAHLAHALILLGEQDRALELYRPVFESDPEDTALAWMALASGHVPQEWQDD